MTSEEAAEIKRLMVENAELHRAAEILKVASAFFASLARRLRSLAQTIGRETGHDPDGSIANWVWRDRNWSPHRYAVYLSFMQAAASQAAATGTWPPDAVPDLLEYALFSASRT
ncbi:hypothetical protein ACFQ7M_35890 [Streptomyces massasporeus]